MTLAQMRHFQAVCKLKNVTRAAAVMHVTQPTVSSSIKELEAEYGINLFHRINKRLSLTQEGELFLERVNTILEQVDALEQQMQDLGNQKNLIHIGVPPMIGTFLFPDMFDAFREMHPSIEIDIMEYGSLHTRVLVENDQLELAIAIADTELNPELHKLPILRTHLLYCVSREHQLANRTVLSLENLQHEPLILFKDDSVQKATVLERFNRLGIQPNVLLSSSQLYTIKKFISKGYCGAFLFQEIADMEPDLVGIPLAEPIAMDICLIWRKNRFIYSDTAKFIHFTKNYCYAPVKGPKK